jgi:hypothetical protein
MTENEAEDLAVAKIVNQMPAREYHTGQCCK